jgi:hypothetical protein
MPVAPAAMAGTPVPATTASFGLRLTVVLACEATTSMNG